MSTDKNPKVYVACLAAYNNGKLHGEWVDAVDAEEIRECIKRVIATSPETFAEEHAFHDYADFSPLSPGEYEDIDTLAQAGAFIAEHGELGARWLGREGYGEPRDDIKDRFEERYQGAYRSLEDYAEQFLEDTGALSEMPETLRYYFDFEKYARDLELSGDVFTIETSDGMTHVFNNH